MNERIKLLAEQAGEYAAQNATGDWEVGPNYQDLFNKKFAELIVEEAFRAGMLYSAKKYAAVCEDRFTGNDVAMFLEMEACELSDEDIKQHFGVEE